MVDWFDSNLLTFLLGCGSTTISFVSSNTALTSLSLPLLSNIGAYVLWHFWRRCIECVANTRKSPIDARVALCKLLVMRIDWIDCFSVSSDIYLRSNFNFNQSCVLECGANFVEHAAVGNSWQVCSTSAMIFDDTDNCIAEYRMHTQRFVSRS